MTKRPSWLDAFAEAIGDALGVILTAFALSLAS